MFRSATLASGQANSAFPVYKFDKWKYKNLRMTGILLRISYPITVTVGTWTVAAFATLIVAILNAAINSLTLSYGSQTQYKPYVGVQGAELRNAHRFTLLRECPNTLPTANVGVGTYTWTIDLEIPFHVPFLTNGRKRLPGFSQIRTMQLEVIEGAAYNNVATGTAARTGGANVTIDVDPLCVYGADRWTPLLSYYKVNTTDFEAVGPDGTHLGAWDDNNSFATTPITLYSLFFDGDPHTESMPPYAADDRYIDDWVQGGTTPATEAAIDDSETVVLSPEIMMDVQDLPHGRISLKLPSMYVATIKLRGLYWPAMTLSEANEAAMVGADQNRGGVLFGIDSDVAYAGEKGARTFPGDIYTLDKPGSTLVPGILVSQPGVTPSISVPSHIKQGVAASISAAAASGAPTAQAAEAAALSNVAKLVPGMAQGAAQVAAAASAQRSQVIRDYFQRQGGVAL